MSHLPRCAIVLALTTLPCGCTHLEPLDAGVCGNSVIEPEAGEDCDGDPGCLSAIEAGSCHFACSNEVACPPGYGCGSDDVCRKASGQYELMGTVDSAATLWMSATDLDGDRTDELVRGTVNRTVFERFNRKGDRTELESLSPTRSLAYVADTNQDGLRDVLFATPYARDSGLASFRTQPDLSLAGTIFASFPLEATALDMIIVDAIDPPQGDDLILFRGDTIAAIDGLGGDWVKLGNVPADEPLADLIEGHFRAGSEALGCTEVAYAFAGTNRLEVLTPCRAVGGKRVWNEAQIPPFAITLPTGVTVPPPSADLRLDHHLFATDLDADGFEDLLIAGQSGGQRGIYAAFGLGNGQFDSDPMAVGPNGNGRAAAYTLDLCGNAEPTCTELPAPPHILTLADFNGDGVDDIVTGLRILFSRGDVDADGDQDYVAREILLPSGLTAASLRGGADGALAGDFNANGKLDLAVVDADIGGVLFLNGAGDGTFAAAVLEAPRPARALAAADFDGDSVLDLALVEQAGVFGDTFTNRVSVAFGTAFGIPQPLVTLGELPLVDRIATGRVIGADSPEDLMVVTRAKADEPYNAAVVAGDGNRQLLAPFVFSREIDNRNVTTRVDAVVVGRFGTQSAVVFTSDDESGGQWAWTLTTTDTSFAASPSDLGSRCNACALAAVDMDGDDVDEVLRFEGNTVRVYQVSGSTVAELTHFDIEGLPFLAAGALFGADLHIPVVADFDADGRQDVAVQVADPTVPSAERKPEVVVFWNDGLGGIPMASSHVAALTLALSAVTAINSDADPELEVAMVSSILGTVAIVQLDPASRTFLPGAEPLKDARSGVKFPTGTLTSGDFDGDGIDDLVLGDDDQIKLLFGIEGH